MFSTALIAKLINDTEQCLYTYPGGTIAPLLHECKCGNVDLIVSRAEQGAGYMALAHASLKGNPSFVAVTSGPGATNLLTCIADAYYDSIPLVAFTGQVGTGDLARSPSLRQRGFQEAPIVAMAAPITKAVFQPRSPEELAEMLVRAYSISRSNRPGPVLIDLPMDVQMAAIEPDLLSKVHIKKNAQKTSIESVLPQRQSEHIKSSLLAAKRPLILAGGGVQKDWLQIRSLAKRLGIPVVSSLRGLGIMSCRDPLYAGWIGHTGLPWANWTLSRADWILVLGSRLDVRQTGTEVRQLEDKIIVHVDIDQNELAHGRFNRTFQVHATAGYFLDIFMQQIGNEAPRPEWGMWINQVQFQKEKIKLNDRGREAGVCPDELFSYVDTLTREEKTAVVTGVGAHQQWAARYFSFDNPHKLFFTSAGHGTMGYCLPVAIGLKRMENDRLVLAIDGDGSFQMNLQELALLKEHNLGLKIIVMNNSRLGIVSQFQQITFGDDPATGHFPNPDFSKISEAYGLTAFKLNKFDKGTVRRWLASPKPSVLHVRVQHDAPVSPMLLAGQHLDNMWYWSPPVLREEKGDDQRDE